MKKYIALFILWFCHSALILAQNDNGFGGFDPSNPPDPVSPSASYRIDLSVYPEGAGYTNLTSGTFQDEDVLTLSATANENFIFQYWVDDLNIIYQGNPLEFTMPRHNVKMKAVFKRFTGYYDCDITSFDFMRQAVITIYDESIPLSGIAAYDLGAFNEKGECVGGATNLQNGQNMIPVGGYYGQESTITFKLYNRFSKHEYDLSSVLASACPGFTLNESSTIFCGSESAPQIMYMPKSQKGQDLTSLIVNHNFADAYGEGWNWYDYVTSKHGGFAEFPCAEAYSQPVDCSQTIEGLPNGLYKVVVNAFYRPDANGSYNGTESVPVDLYLNDFYTPVQHILSDAIAEDQAIDQFNTYQTYFSEHSDNIFTHIGGSDMLDYNYDGKFIPNGMTGASVAFMADRYQQVVYGLIKDGKLELGLTSHGKNIHWSLWTNFRLFYMEKDPEALKAVLQNYAGRAQTLIDEQDCQYAYQEACAEVLQNAIDEAVAMAELGEDGDTMYDALMALNEAMNTFKDQLAAFDQAVSDFEEAYTQASNTRNSFDYSGAKAFDQILSEAYDYKVSGYVSQDSKESDLQYMAVMMNMLRQAASDYLATANVPFEAELDILNKVAPGVDFGDVSESHITSLDLSGQNLTDKNDVFTLLELPDLNILDLSNNGIANIPEEYMDKLKTLDELDLNNQAIDVTVTLDYGKIEDYENTIDELPNLPYYDKKSNSFMANGFSMKLSTEKPGDEDSEWALQFGVNEDGEMEVEGVYGDGVSNIYRGELNKTFYVTYPDAAPEVEGSYYNANYTFQPGDVNFQGGVDATDLQSVVNMAFNEYETEEPVNFTAADLYADGEINVQDIILMVNLLLTDEANSNKVKAYGKMAAEDVENAEAQIFIRDNQVVLQTTRPVSAILVKAQGQINWTMDACLTQAVAGSNVVAYSLSGETLPVGEIVIGTCHDDAVLRRISLSDAKAKAIKAVVTQKQETAVKGVQMSQKGAAYNTSGIRQEKAGKGISIVKRGDETIKVLNK